MASDLLLLAVRYISCEMPDDERAAFEHRLEHDQAAREAVAQAVELASALAQLPATTPDTLPMVRPRRRWQRMAALAAAACVALASGIVLSSRVSEPPPSVPAIVAPPAPSGSVALAWSGLRQSGEIDLVTHSELVAWLDDPVAAPVDTLLSSTSDAEDDGLPGWLLEATSLRQPSASGGLEEN